MPRSLETVRAIQRIARPITGTVSDFDGLIATVRGARIVALGEATHGTHEFYATRAAITRRLIEQEGFTAVALEADWPDAYRVNRFVQRLGNDRDADAALSGFDRFPTWMWRNRDVLDFVRWLRRHNERSTGRPVGFYGLDLYSLHASAQAVIDYLHVLDPAAATRARRRYSCFEPFTAANHAYGRAVVLGVSEPCRERVFSQLAELRRRAGEYLMRDGMIAEDEQFFAEQNAQVVADAEEYYRTMFAEPASSWNLRDRHMADTLDALLAHLDRHGGSTRVVVWAHNTHVGDARANDMHDRGECSIGQLLRERHARDAALVGFTTYKGSVTAAAGWGNPPLRLSMPSALRRSVEASLHQVGIPAFCLPFDDDRLADLLRDERPMRAVGVIYRPEVELSSHYRTTRVSQEFDALVHIDGTTAVQPLDSHPSWDLLEPPETYPTAL